jgi:predicted tellurium resistance membrane protein TerC
MTGEGKAYLGTILGSVFLILLGVGFIAEGPKHIPTFAAYAVGAVLILLAMLLIISLVSKRSVRSRTRTIRKR